MFAIERMKIIKNYLDRDKHVSVAMLSSILNVTEVTIRRDLEKLEKEGYLKRTHGGAVINENNDPAPLPEPIDDNSLQFQNIADTVFHLVSDHDIIMLTDGEVNRYVAKRLTHKNNLTVLTNDIIIALEFSSFPANNLILVGGNLEEYALYGQLSINNMQNFSLNHLIVEVDGISKNFGVTVSSINKASLIQQACQIAKTVSLVCPSHKFGEKSFCRVGDINMAQKIITDPALENSYKDYIFDLDIQLYTSVDIYEAE